MSSKDTYHTYHNNQYEHEDVSGDKSLKFTPSQKRMLESSKNENGIEIEHTCTTDDMDSKKKIMLRSIKGLTDDDLISLFTRLDTSGDGLISKEEIKNISTIFSDELPYSFEDRFDDHDIDKNNHLSKEEFVSLMKKIVASYHTVTEDNDPNIKQDFITAIRYGWIWRSQKCEKEFVFDLYHGLVCSHDLNEEKITEDGEKKDKPIVKYILNDKKEEIAGNGEEKGSLRGTVGELTAEEVTIDELNKMMTKDNELNRKFEELSKSIPSNASSKLGPRSASNGSTKKPNKMQQIYYWVDIAMGSPDNIKKYITDFNLADRPDKFKNNFKAGNVKGEKRDKKGNEKRSKQQKQDHRQKVDHHFQANYCTSSKTASLSLLLPSMSLKYRPVAYSLPALLDFNSEKDSINKKDEIDWKYKILDSIIDSLKNYYLKRISFFFPTSESNFKQAIYREEYWRIKGAFDLAAQVLNEVSDEKSSEKSTTTEVVGKPGISRFERKLNELKSPDLDEPKPGLRPNDPSWLVSERDWSKLEFYPHLETQSLSLSLISPVHSLISPVHSTIDSITPVGVITLRLYEKESECFNHEVIPKKKDKNYKPPDPWTKENYKYLSKLSRTGPIGRLLASTRTKLLELTNSAASGQNPISNIAKIVDHPFSLATYLIAFVNAYNSETLLRSEGPIDKWLELLEEEMKESIISKHQSHIIESKKILMKIGKYIDSSLILFNSFYESENSEKDGEKKGLENLNLIPDVTKGYKIISNFFGNDKRERCGYLRDIIDGTLGFKSGLVYLKDRCDTLLELNAELREDIKYTIEERRNFYSFLLTAITIAIAPITILTGYFGMNFENMTELSADTYPSVPGVELLWVILTIFYGLLFVIAIHSGLFYKLFC